LRRLGIDVADSGLAIDGMVVTGPGGVRVSARYPPGVLGRAIVRRQLDAALLRQAANAGATIEEGVLVQHALVEGVPSARGGARVTGLVVRAGTGQVCHIRARLIIAADGRASRIARGVRLSRFPEHPRRWAVGAYFAGVGGLTTLGEMHVRPGHYIGVAPLPDGVVNACVVTADARGLADPEALLRRLLNGEPDLRERFRRSQIISRPVMLGPLAVECAAPGMPGLLLAGDAAGFIDPMTGDGLRFALRGAELAAIEGLRALETGSSDAHSNLAVERRREFRAKWRFNRVLRRLVGCPGAVRVASRATRYAGWPLGRVIRYAGDLTAT